MITLNRSQQQRHNVEVPESLTDLEHSQRANLALTLSEILTIDLEEAEGLISR